MQATIIGVLGKPLSGKDTIARGLSESNPMVAAISMGEVLRDVKSTGPTHRFWDVLHESAEVASQGGLAYDYPVFQCLTELVAEKLTEGKTTILWIGGPKSEYQLGLLDAWAKGQGMDQKFLSVHVSDSEVYHRLDGRNDGREDDNAERVRVRLNLFDTSIQPMVDHLRREGRLTEISGIGSKETVASRAAEALGLKLRDPEISLPAMARR